MYFKVVDENGNEWFLYGNHNLNPAEFFRVAGGDINGRVRIKNKLLVSQLAGFQDGEPSILLAIGDSDTGFHSMGDGTTGYYSNGRHVFNMTSLWGSHNFDPDQKSSIHHNHNGVYAPISHGHGYVEDMRYTAMVMRFQGERNDRYSVEFGSGILVTAATYGEGPNVCTQNTRQIQILRNGSWVTVGY